MRTKYSNLEELDSRLKTMQANDGLEGVSFCSFLDSDKRLNKAERNRIAGAICALLELNERGVLSRVSSDTL